MDHATDNMLFMYAAVSAVLPRHDHLLQKDPLRLGWLCQFEGCRFFKPAEEFDAVQVVG